MSRWQDIKSNPKLRANLETRAKLLRAIRAFFDARGYVEMETPLVVAKPGMEPYLDPFETELLTPAGEKRRAFLITSPEYALKKLLAAGFPKIYQLGKCFRNAEDSGGRHNPEFTMLEWYRTGTDYLGIMDETEEMIKSVAKDVAGPVAPLAADVPWERLSVKEAFKRYADLDLDTAIQEVNVLIRMAQKMGHRMADFSSFDDAFFTVFLNAIEPKLGRGKPTFLYDYPLSMAALSKPSKKDPRYAERFELYVDGLELTNAFSELTDVDVQRQRLEEERELRKRLGKTDYSLDEDFIAALSEMPEAGGISLGVDRLLMLLTGTEDICDVIAFPTGTMFDSSQKSE